MDYETFSPTADKWLQPDGSVTTSAGALILPADPDRAAEYDSRMPRAAKWLMPDGSVTASPSGGGGSAQPLSEPIPGKDVKGSASGFPDYANTKTIYNGINDQTFTATEDGYVGFSWGNTIETGELGRMYIHINGINQGEQIIPHGLRGDFFRPVSEGDVIRCRVNVDFVGIAENNNGRIKFTPLKGEIDHG